RKSKRIREGRRLRADGSSVSFAGVGDHEVGGHIVVGVKAASRRPCAGSGQRPVLFEFRIYAKARTQRLRDRVSVTLDSPGAQKFRDRRRLNAGAEAMLQARIGNRLVVLVYRRTEEQVSSAVSGQQCVLAPGTANAKIDSPGKVPRMQ